MPASAAWDAGEFDYGSIPFTSLTLARIVASPVGCGWAQVRLCESTEKKHGLESVAHHPFTGGQRNDIDIQPHSERDHHNCHHRSLCDVEYAHEHHQFLPRTPALTLAESQHLCNKAVRQAGWASQNAGGRDRARWARAASQAGKQGRLTLEMDQGTPPCPDPRVTCTADVLRLSHGFRNDLVITWLSWGELSNAYSRCVGISCSLSFWFFRAFSSLDSWPDTALEKESRVADGMDDMSRLIFSSKPRGRRRGGGRYICRCSSWAVQLFQQIRNSGTQVCAAHAPLAG